MLLIHLSAHLINTKETQNKSISPPKTAVTTIKLILMQKYII